MRKIGIIICDRYSLCAGGKCFKALKNREGAFQLYQNEQIELIGYTSCGGCPGGNIEYAPAEMKKNGIDIIHLATGLVVGYPPCLRLESFYRFIPSKYNIKVIIGTHPIPQNYYITHLDLGTWSSKRWQEYIKHIVTDEKTRIAYN